MTIPRLEFNVKHRPRSHITPDQVNLVSLRIKTGEIETTMRTEVASILKLRFVSLGLSTAPRVC